MNYPTVISSKIEYKQSSQKSQGWSHEDPLPIPEIIANPVQYLKDNLTKSDFKVLNFVFTWENTHRVLYFAYDTIAESLGMCKRTVIRSMNKLRRLGLLGTNYRHMKSCEFRISKWFRDVKIRSALSGLFNAFVIFPVMLFSKNVTQIDSFYLYNINNNISLTSDSVRASADMSIKVPRATLPPSEKVVIVTRRENFIAKFKKMMFPAALATALCSLRMTGVRRKDIKTGRESMYKNKYLPPDDPWAQERVAPTSKAQPTFDGQSSTPKRREIVATPYPVISREDSLRQKAASDDRAELSQSQRGKPWRKTFAQDWVYRKDNGL